jgi:hypothetical protein
MSYSVIYRKQKKSRANHAWAFIELTMGKIARLLFSAFLLVLFVVLMIEVIFAFEHGYFLRAGDILKMILGK